MTNNMLIFLPVYRVKIHNNITREESIYNNKKNQFTKQKIKRKSKK